MPHYEMIIDKGYAGINPVQFGYENCSPSHSFGPAVRSHWLLHYVISGYGRFEREGKAYRVSPGEIFVIPPYLETYYEADKDHPWQYIWIGFLADDKLSAVFGTPIIRCPGVGQVFEDMRRCGDMESGKSAFLSSRIWELISLLLESDKERVDYIEKALHYIRSEYMYDINIGLLAERLNLDRSYFTTLFTQKIGVPPGKYLSNLRLEKAAELMTVYGESPTTAAMSVGYPDIYHFSKAFKQKYGCSPRQYRRENT